MSTRIVWSFFLGVLFSQPCFATTKVGNGDEGADLENLTPIEKGVIVQGREEALVLLKKLNIQGVPGLGSLIPEIQGTSMFLVKEDQRAGTIDSDKAKYHSSEEGLVYARTLAQPYAPTRFFPIAEKLSIKQLVALHIHEGLHRALPASIREDERVTSELTLAIVSPEASHDSVREIAGGLVPVQVSKLPANPMVGMAADSNYELPESKLAYPSSLAYSFAGYLPTNSNLGLRLDRAHIISSDLYPFGGRENPFGLGLLFSLWDTPKGLLMGPLGVSARTRVWTHNGFDVGLWGEVSLNTLSQKEIKESLHGRDLFTLGISMRKYFGVGYVENFLGYTFASYVEENLGLMSAKYEYGGVFNAKIRAGFHLWKIDLGGFIEVHLADNFKLVSGKYSSETGRYRLVSVGPELAFSTAQFNWSLHGRFLMDSTKDADFTHLGNLLGVGTAQGYVGTSVRFYF